MHCTIFIIGSTNAKSKLKIVEFSIDTSGKVRNLVKQHTFAHVIINGKH